MLEYDVLCKAKMCEQEMTEKGYLTVNVGALICKREPSKIYSEGLAYRWRTRLAINIQRVIPVFTVTNLSRGLRKAFQANSLVRKEFL